MGVRGPLACEVWRTKHRYDSLIRPAIEVPGLAWQLGLQFRTSKTNSGGLMVCCALRTCRTQWECQESYMEYSCRTLATNTNRIVKKATWDGLAG